MPGTVQTALSALQQQLGEAIQQETARTEERVRAYSEQQYAALEEFREHAHRDHRVLARYGVMHSVYCRTIQSSDIVRCEKSALHLDIFILNWFV
jgi:hypothetical protein